MDVQGIGKSFQLFRNGCGVETVAYKLGISTKQAKQLKNSYLQNELFYEEILYENYREEITQYYIEQSLEQRKELVESFLDLIKTEKLKGFKGVDDPEIGRRLGFIMRFLRRSTISVILFPPDGGKAVKVTI